MKGLSRREFLTMLAGAGVAVPTGLLAAGGFRFLSPNVSSGHGSQFVIGKAEDYPLGTVKVFPERRLTVVSRENGLVAMSLICTHLGCTVNTVEWGYQCPCHGSRFDVNGLVLGGPAPKPLAWYRIDEQLDGRLVVDTNRTVRRGAFFRLT